jgi:hypothetical protein
MKTLSRYRNCYMRTDRYGEASRWVLFIFLCVNLQKHFFLRRLLVLLELGVQMQSEVTQVAEESYANCSLLRRAVAVKFKTLYVCLVHRNTVDSSPSVRPLCLSWPRLFLYVSGTIFFAHFCICFLLWFPLAWARSYVCCRHYNKCLLQTLQ